jgi:hypothetical protein
MMDFVNFWGIVEAFSGVSPGKRHIYIVVGHNKVEAAQTVVALWP